MLAEPKWHPIMSAREYEPGKWVLVDSFEKPYALIDFIRRGGELGYRLDALKRETNERRTIQYYRTLAAACAHGHGLWINRGVPHGAPNGNTAWPQQEDYWG